MEDKRNTGEAKAQTRDPRPASERSAAQVDVLSSCELRLSSAFLSRHLDARAENERGQRVERKG